MVSWSERCLGCVKVADLPVRRAAEYTDARPLSLFILHVEILVERIAAAGQEPDFVPIPGAGPLPESREVDSCNQREINFIAHVRSNPGVPVGPHIAHGTGELIIRSPHHVIDDEPVLSGSEELR